MAEPGLIKITDNSKKKSNNRRLWLRLHLTNLCNFNCPGCHVFKISPNNIPFDNMPYSVAEKAIDFHLNLMKKYLPPDKWITRISVYGGEPLLNRPVLYRILRKYGKTYQGIRLDWIVNTNGSLLNSEDLKVFAIADVDIHMSLDGKEQSHNQKRPDKLKKGTFERVIKAIELCKEMKYPYLQFDSVADPFNTKSIDELLEIASDYGINRIHLDLFYSPKYPENFSFEEYAEAYSEAYIKGEEKGISIFASPFSQIYSNFLNKTFTRPFYLVFPSLQFFVDGSFIFGELPLCKPFDYLDSLVLFAEDIWDKRMDLLQKSEKEVGIKCKNCFLKESCQGGMRRIFRYHTLTAKGEKNICEITRRSIKLLVKKKYG